jgi:HK97 family phage prohead protease
MATQATQPERREWDGIVRRSLDIECRSVDQAQRSVDVIASTASLDAHGDIVEQDFDLKRFEKNPVVLWNHNAFGMFDGSTAKDFLPIGRAESVSIKGGQLEARLVFASAEANPLAEQVFRLMQEKILRAVSIGFRPGDSVSETVDGKKRFRLKGNELFEISVVPIPSNPDAVAKSIAWERENLGRAAASKTADSGKDSNMTEQEKALQDALTAKGVADAKAQEAGARADKLEAELKQLKADIIAEKTLSAKLTADLDKANAELATAKSSEAKSVLDGLQGKKFAPAEREELDALVKDLGLERVQKLLEKRPDIALTESVKTIDRSGVNPPAAELTNSSAGADIASEAMKGL